MRAGGAAQQQRYSCLSWQRQGYRFNPQYCETKQKQRNHQKLGTELDKSITVQIQELVLCAYNFILYLYARDFILGYIRN